MRSGLCCVVAVSAPFRFLRCLPRLFVLALSRLPSSALKTWSVTHYPTFFRYSPFALLSLLICAFVFSQCISRSHFAALIVSIENFPRAAQQRQEPQRFTRHLYRNYDKST